MLGMYTGPLILREPDMDHNPLHKRYPLWRNQYAKRPYDHKVTLEQELTEIRARHAARREYNRQLRAARAARKKQGLTHGTTDHCTLDESDT